MATILIPGIKGSELTDSYPLDWPVRWNLADMMFGDAFENPLDFALLDGRYERNDGHRMLPYRPIRFAYGEMVGKLRAWRPEKSLYVFTYDWRRPVEHAAARLAAFRDEVAGRERALGRDGTIDFVAHSMGGLVLRAALGLANARDPLDGVGRVVFIAPPFRGTIAAVQMLVAGERDGWFGTDEDYRKIARSFPSVYQMTPHYAGCATDEDGAPVDLYDPRNWQANVRDGRGGFDVRFLAAARDFAFGGAASAAPLVPDEALAAHDGRVLVLLSAGHDTPRRVTVQTRNPHNPNWFDFAGMDRDRLGDGRVHMASAAVPGVTLAAFAGALEHGRVCRDTRVINTVSLWLEGRRALKMTPRGPDDPAERTSRRHFDAWDGDPASLGAHVA